MNRPLQLKLAAAGVVLLVVLVAVYLRLSDIDPDTRPKRKEDGGVEKPLEGARNILRKGADLSSCRLALRQINVHLTDPDAKQPHVLDATRKEELRRQLDLKEDELAELESRSFTLLDGQHLELCLLLHDAARALETQPRSGNVPPQVEATAAFAWVVRQVGLDRIDTEVARERVLAPQLVLRRGFGSPLARALLFLGLVAQLGHDGCLLALPGDPPGHPRERVAPRYWACGVLGEKEHIYLFDPRLGIPLPGPGGKGIATLAEVQGKDSPLRQLNFGGNLHYDVTPEQAAESEIHLIPSLSALAPRMAFLEKELLKPAVSVRLAADSAAETRFARALKASGHKKTDVKLAAWAALLQRRFFPKSEGGINPNEQRNAMRELVKPYLDLLLNALPPRVRPRSELDLWVPPIDRIIDPYLQQFLGPLLTPGQSRDLMLRGQYAEAQAALGPVHERTLEQQKQYEALFKGQDARGPQEIQAWYDEASRAAARGEAGGVEEVAKKYERALGALLAGAGVERRIAEIAYLQNLCQQEMAERLQFRLDHFPKEVSDREVEQAERLWKETRNSWENYLNLPVTLLPGRPF
ncbi:MAG: hypothetical protein HYS12_08480, partial [Planctomycetes bacterium]|nr:hypothetical protein [Planctomycetota bacterium]